MKVSCLMTTLPLPARIAGMCRAIRAWQAQTHEDRELIVAIDRPSATAQAEAAAMIAAIGDSRIQILLPETRMSLGLLRNLTVDAAAGEAICQWDDDDHHHPQRIAAQLAAIEGAGRPATVLQDVMMFDEGDRTLRWTNWAATPAGGHPGTLLCRRDVMPLYPDMMLGEDLAVLERLRDAGLLHLQGGAPYLYIYASHAANITAAAHRAMLADRLAISTGLLRKREAMLRAGLAPFDLGPGSVSVQGGNGTAFMLRDG